MTARGFFGLVLALLTAGAVAELVLLEPPPEPVISLECEPVADQVVCITITGSQRIVEWGPAEDSMVERVATDR